MSVVMKFGGTSVADAAAFENVARIVAGERESAPVVVVSAMSGVTDALLAATNIASLQEVFERHRSVSRELLDDARAAEFVERLSAAEHQIAELLEAFAQRPSERKSLQDAVVSYGEILSSTLLAAVLNQRGIEALPVDARRCIITDEEHTCAAPLIAETFANSKRELLPILESKVVPVLGGFIGATPHGVTTTLGRGGSDYTAALLGAALGASEIQIWTDVTGVLTADPRVVPEAQTIERLSYSEAAELAYFGAKVLHPKTIQPAIESSIPVRICNSRAPQEAGTLVGPQTKTSPRTIKAIAHKTGVTTVQITSARMLGAYGFLRALFEVFERHRTVVDVVTTSEVSVSLSLDDASKLPAIVEELERLGTVRVEKGRAIICVVGEGLHGTPGIAARVFSTIKDINVTLISQGASSINFTFAIEEERVKEAVTRLHEAFFATTRHKSFSHKKAQKAQNRRMNLFELTRSLIDIPSVTGDELAVGQYLSRYLEELGYRVERQEVAQDRFNVIATRHEPPRIVFSTHIDTVPPFIESSEDAEFIYGRGSCDAKGIIAAQIFAAERLRAEDVNDVGLLFTVDEELSSIGAQAANKHTLASECQFLINGEPTDNRLATGTKGSVRVIITTEGRAAHSAYPEAGESAIEKLLDILQEIRAHEWPEDSFFGTTTCNIGVISGGTRPNVIPDKTRAELQIRLGIDIEHVKSVLEDAVRGRGQLEYASAHNPVRLFSIPGFEQCVVRFTTDIPYLSNWGKPLLLGPGSILDAHTAHERISKDELKKAVKLYVDLAKQLNS